MAGNQIPGVIGTTAPSARKGGEPEVAPPMAGLDLPGPVGVDGAIPQQSVTRTVVAVTKDWEPPNPSTTPEIVVGGDTLEQVAQELSVLPEWGDGGGMLRSDRIPAGISESITVTLHANLLKRLPRWTNYAQASVAVKAEWDRMIGNLDRHEQHHVDIAIEEADNLAVDLIGVEISQIANMVTAANRVIHERQVQYDADTNNGEDEGVTLNFSIV